jgi:hypothetical protein
MGCGRVGATLAKEFQDLGHTVAVIDQDREAFRRLGADFNGQTVAGVGFDRDTLIEAGIERADAFAAVSNGDNSNILAARVARETYGVKSVVARIYDPARAEIYHDLASQQLLPLHGLRIKFCADFFHLARVQNGKILQVEFNLLKFISIQIGMAKLQASSKRTPIHVLRLLLD